MKHDVSSSSLHDEVSKVGGVGACGAGARSVM